MAHYGVGQIRVALFSSLFDIQPFAPQLHKMILPSPRVRVLVALIALNGRLTSYRLVYEEDLPMPDGWIVSGAIPMISGEAAIERKSDSEQAPGAEPE
jgi:hypothetical protein